MISAPLSPCVCRLVWPLCCRRRPCARRRQAPGRTPSSSHRICAIYDLKLDQLARQARRSSRCAAASSTILRRACEGYALQFRQVTELDSGEGKVALSDLRTTTWEEGEGKSFRFKSQNYMDQQQIGAVDGRPTRTEGGRGQAEQARGQEVRGRPRWCFRPSTCAA